LRLLGNSQSSRNEAVCEVKVEAEGLESFRIAVVPLGRELEEGVLGFGKRRGAKAVGFAVLFFARLAMEVGFFVVVLEVVGELHGFPVEAFFAGRFGFKSLKKKRRS
jgi:hypothetical protein